MNINDDYILNHFILNGKVNSQKVRYMNDEVREYLFYRFDDVKNNDSISEILYRIKHNIVIRPKCKVCGNNLIYRSFDKGYFSSYCSEKCALSIKGKYYHSKLIKKSFENKNYYGIDESLKYDTQKELDDKILETYIKENGKTNISRIARMPDNIIEYLYNRFDDIDQNDTIIEILYRIKHNIVIKPKCKVCGKNAIFKNFNRGYSNMFCSVQCSKTNKGKDLIYKATTEGCFHKHGVYNNLQLESCKIKRLETMKLHGTFNTSKPENDLYEILLNLGYDVNRQYKSIEYPFNCDFYLPKYDLYIEFQGSHYHYGRPFLENALNIKELDKLKSYSNKRKLKNPAKKNQYDRIIYIWSISDVKKRTTAIKNKVSLLELYKIPDNDTLKELIEKVSKENLVYQYY